MPVTSPVADPTVALAGAELLHVPPPKELVNNVIPFSHTAGDPLTAGGKGLIVTTAVAGMQVGTVYEIRAVPADIPVTRPVAEPTVTVASKEDHTPPGTASVSVMFAAGQIAPPVTGAGGVFTVMVIVAAQPANT